MSFLDDSRTDLWANNKTNGKKLKEKKKTYEAIKVALLVDIKTDIFWSRCRKLRSSPTIPKTISNRRKEKGAKSPLKFIQISRLCWFFLSPSSFYRQSIYHVLVPNLGVGVSFAPLFACSLMIAREPTYFTLFFFFLWDWKRYYDDGWMLDLNALFSYLDQQQISQSTFCCQCRFYHFWQIITVHIAYTHKKA